MKMTMNPNVLSSSWTPNVQEALEAELRRLEKILGMNDGLKITWIPDGNNKLSGEVKKKTIFIYETDLDSVLETLRHEIIDYLICQAIQPYKDIANRLILLLNEIAYKEKEDLVRRLCNLL